MHFGTFVPLVRSRDRVFFTKLGSIEVNKAVTPKDIISSSFFDWNLLYLSLELCERFHRVDPLKFSIFSKFLSLNYILVFWRVIKPDSVVCLVCVVSAYPRIEGAIFHWISCAIDVFLIFVML